MAERKVIGKMCCKFCAAPDQLVIEAVNGKAYVMCSECEIQSFTRSKHGDTKLRSFMAPPVVPKDPPAAAAPPASGVARKAGAMW